ncbi:hypothetical protein M153_1334000252, partial [Pseudoloma neurophilia]
MMNQMPAQATEAINKLPDSDMASVIKAVKEYSGSDNEDINLLIKEVTMITRATNLDEQEQMRLIIIKLRDSARSWCSELMATKE